MAEHRYYTVFDLLEEKGKDALQKKLDEQLRSTPSLSGLAGATGARLKPGEAWQVTAVLSWLPDPVDTPMIIDEERMKTAQPVFTPHGLMYAPYAEGATVYTLKDSPAPMAVEMEIALEAVVEAWDRTAVQEDGKVRLYTLPVRFILPARLNMEDRKLQLGTLEAERPFSLVPDRIYLNEYLLPIRWDARGADLLAMRMLREFMPECLQYPLPMDPYELVRRMGLHLSWKLLSKDCSILGEIFDRNSQTYIMEILTRMENDAYFVAAGTILLDHRLLAGKLYPMQVIYTTLTHECVHWYKDRLYIALQNVFSPQFCLSICRAHPTEAQSGLFALEDSRGLNLSLPPDLMEAQAMAIPPHLLINAEAGRRKTEEIIQQFGGKITEENRDAILREMRSFFGVTLYAAAKRLREFGYIVPRAVHDPRFQYQKKQDPGITWEISFDRMMELLDQEKYPEYYQLISSGLFIHADGRLCLNSAEYILYDAAGVPHLTAQARSNPAVCCMPFRTVVIHNPELRTGAMAAARHKSAIVQSIPEPSPALEEARQKFDSEMRSTVALDKMTLGVEMEYHRRNTARITFQVWTERSFVSQSRLQRLCRDPVKPKPEFRVFLRALLGLQLKPLYSLPLIKKARLSMPDEPEHERAVLNVLLTCYTQPVLEVHKQLCRYGYPLIDRAVLKKNDLDERGEVLEI